MRHDFLEIHASDPHSCLASAKARILDDLDTEGEPAKVGTAVHRVAETIAFERAESPMLDVFAVARRVLREEAKTLRMSPGARVDAAAILAKCLADDSRISLWPRMGWSGKPELRWGLVADGDDYAFVENPTEPCDAAGTIDLPEWAGNELAVTDYKSTLQMFSSQEAYESFQLRLYVVAMLRKFPDASKAEGRFALLRHGYYASADFARGDSWERQTIEQVRAERDARATAVETGEFPETPGEDCHWCPVLLKCETALRYASMGAVALGALSPEEAARAWLAAKAVAARLEKFVKKHVELHGSIALGDPHGTVLGFHEIEGKETLVSYERTMELLREFGMSEAQFVEHFRFVAPNHFAARVKKVAMEVLGVDRETLERLVIPVTKSEFTTFVPELRHVAEAMSDEGIDTLIDDLLGSG